MSDLQFQRLSFSLRDVYTQPAVDLIYGSIVKGDQPDLCTAVERLAKHDVRYYGLIEDDERLVAVGSLMEAREDLGENPEWAWVEELVVDPMYRRRGLGRHLLGHLEQTAVDTLGVSAVTLYPESKVDPKVHDFYKHLGYVACPELPMAMIKYLDD